MTTRLSRRALLALAGAGSVGLAGCLDSGAESAGANPDTNTDTDSGVSSENTETDTTEVETDDKAAKNSTEKEGTSSSTDDESANEHEGLPTWMTTELENVTGDEAFTLASFDRPVLLETFAVWCSTCLSQQRESKEFHERVGDDVVTVGLNVDPNEDTDAVREHAETHGFDWFFSISPPDVTRSLADQFGDSIANPSSAPIVLICPDGEFRRLEDGVKSAETLESEVEAGC